jgi:hypothetical protein
VHGGEVVFAWTESAGTDATGLRVRTAAARLPGLPR